MILQNLQLKYRHVLLVLDLKSITCFKIRDRCCWSGAFVSVYYGWLCSLAGALFLVAFNLRNTNKENQVRCRRNGLLCWHNLMLDYAVTLSVAGRAGGGKVGLFSHRNKRPWCESSRYDLSLPPPGYTELESNWIPPSLPLMSSWSSTILLLVELLMRSVSKIPNKLMINYPVTTKPLKNLMRIVY